MVETHIIKKKMNYSKNNDDLDIGQPIHTIKFHFVFHLVLFFISLDICRDAQQECITEFSLAMYEWFRVKQFFNYLWSISAREKNGKRTYDAKWSCIYIWYLIPMIVLFIGTLLSRPGQSLVHAIHKYRIKQSNEIRELEAYLEQRHPNHLT